MQSMPISERKNMKHSHHTTPQDIGPALSEIGKWYQHLQQLHERIVPHFARPEPAHHALLYMQALLSEIPRKNGWQIAEQARQTRPFGIQRLLTGSVWDVEAVRDELCAHILEHLGRCLAIAVLDESSFPKRGKKSAGVKKQYCGTTGRVENCQVGVFLSYVTALGHALLDRELYLPQDWLLDRKRCQQAGIPETVQFRPKWELGLLMLKRAKEAGIRFSWTVADSVYGQATDLRLWLEKHEDAYVLGIPSDFAVCVQGQSGFLLAEARETEKTLVKEQDWQRLSMSQGTKGPRLFDWALLPIVHQGAVDGRHFLLIRRCLDDPNEKAYYLVFCPVGTPLSEIVLAIGARWHVEEDLQATKDLLGLDQYEVRSFSGWYRHITLVMLTYAALVGIRVSDRSHLPQTEPVCACPPLLPITTSEIHHLLAQLLFPSPSAAPFVLAWSQWRRLHQSWASHYHSRARLKAG